MNLKDFLNTILSEVSGQRAWNWSAKIFQFNRIHGSNSYREIAEIIKK